MRLGWRRGRGWVTVLASAVLIGAWVAPAVANDSCSREGSLRGVGKAPTVCADSSYALDDGLCNKKCPAGYDGKGNTCIAVCPSGFRDDGLYCAKTAPYSVGVGRVSENLCKSNSKFELGCHEVVGLWYPKCKPGYLNVGGSTCSPECPRGWSDTGLSCKRLSVQRSAGVAPNACPQGQRLVAGLCYETCKASYRAAIEK